MKTNLLIAAKALLFNNLQRRRAVFEVYSDIAFGFPKVLEPPHTGLNTPNMGAGIAYILSQEVL